MHFLSSIPIEARCLLLKDLTVGEKCELLKAFIEDSSVLMEIQKHLEDLATADDFLRFVTNPKKKRLLLMILKLGDSAKLDKIISEEDEIVQKAYEAWKRRNELISAVSQTEVIADDISSLNSHAESDDLDSVSNLAISPDEEAGKEEVEKEAADFAFNRDFFDKFPDCTNILILGETGVGKSTFINGLVNYLKYGSIDEALEGGVEILIKTYFTHTDEDYNRMRIECDPTVEVERGEGGDDEVTVEGQSSTQAPKSYLFSWGPPGAKKSIRIIDTPGVGDVRGLDQEKTNFAKILSFIADFSEIHAICVLLKPNESKLTLTFRYCINELLAHLHVSASRNIIFCFTNARQTLYRPGDTLPTLDAHLKELYRKRGIEMPLTSDTMFCFDNESFRFLCAVREGADFDEKDRNSFNGSWVKSVEETFRLFKRISELPVHNVDDTLSVNNIRSVIMALARPLAEIARNQLINVKLIEDKLREIQECVEQGKDLDDKLYVDQVKILAKEIPYPMTVCTARSCVDYMRFSPNLKSALETVYKTECHSNCTLKGVQTSICPNPAIMECEAIGYEAPHLCLVCKCPWTTHMHIRYKLEKTMEKTVDPTVQQSIKNRDDAIHTAQLFIANETKRKKELQEEADKISQACVEFAAFLRSNSILPYNDVYQEYVEHLIKEEKEKVSMGGSPHLLGQLNTYKDEYEQQVKILESHRGTSTGVKNIKQIYNMVDDLKRMRNCGSILVEVQKLELLSVRSQQITKATPVDLNSGWLGQMVTNGYKKKAKRGRKNGGGKKK